MECHAVEVSQRDAVQPALSAIRPHDETPKATDETLTNNTFERVDSVMDEGTAGLSIKKTDPVETAPPAPASTPIDAPAPAVKAAEVRVLGLHEWKEAALSLAQAFEQDHTSLYFLDTPERAHWTRKQKWDLHLKIMEYLTYAHLLKGLVVSVGPNYDCVALWLPPGEDIDSPVTLLRSGLWRLSYMLCREGRKRFFTEFMPLLTDTKLSVMGLRDPHSWYLVYIGTRPSGRGKGYARRAIEFVTRQADARGQACYLESSHEVNRQIYAKLGFRLVKHIYLQRAEEHVALDIMVREPRVEREEMKLRARCERCVSSVHK